MLFQTTAAHFDDVLAESREQLVLLDFYAPWCAPCRALAPELDALSDRYEEHMSAYSVNTDTDPDIAAAYNVKQLPTVVLLYGETRLYFTEDITKDHLEQEIRRLCRIG